jgi:hypothetical protein
MTDQGSSKIRSISDDDSNDILCQIFTDLRPRVGRASTDSPGSHKGVLVLQRRWRRMAARKAWSIKIFALLAERMPHNAAASTWSSQSSAVTTQKVAR